MAISSTGNKDFDLKFSKRQHLSKNSDIRTLTDNPKRVRFPAIEQSIANIILTNRGERPFQPEYGGNIYDTLFEQVPYFGDGTSALEINITERIKASLNNYEPRVSVLGVRLVPDRDSMSLADQRRLGGLTRTGGSSGADKNSINIEIVYRVIPMTETLVFNLKLKRVR
jgi:phage baseplate assembly protein W